MMSALTLRPVEYADAIALLAWRDIETRRFSGSLDPIAFEAHLAWFFDKMHEARHWYIASNQTGAIGVGRLDRNGVGWWISVALDRRARGHGHGEDLIRLVTARVEERVWARIHRFNRPSLRAFEKAGYVYDRSESVWQIYRHDPPEHASPGAMMTV